MQKIIKHLKDKYNLILLIIGVLLVLLSNFEITNFKELKIQSTSLIYPLFILGLILIIISVFLELNILSWRNKKIKKNKKENFSIKLGKSKINIFSGRIEKIQLKSNLTFVLPANEYFDDECIVDKKSVLGSFIQTHFPNQEKIIQKLIFKELENRRTEIKEKKEGVSQKSYEIGTSILIKEPLNSSINLIITAVTKQDVENGIYSNISFLIKASDNIQKILYNNRLDKVYIPLLGSGHGGLNDKASLFTLVLSFWNFINLKQNKEIYFIIFKKNKDTKSTINQKDTLKILNTVCNLFE